MNLSNITNVNSTTTAASDSSLVDRSSSSSSFEQLLSAYNNNNNKTTTTNTTSTNTATAANSSTTANSTTTNNNSTNTQAASSAATEQAPATEPAPTETTAQNTTTSEEAAAVVVGEKAPVLVGQHTTKRPTDDSLTADDATTDAVTDVADVPVLSDDALTAVTSEVPVATDTTSVTLAEPDAATQSLLAMLTQPQLLPVETTATTPVAVPVSDLATITGAAALATQGEAAVAEPVQTTVDNLTAGTSVSGLTLNAQTASSASVRDVTEDSTTDRVTADTDKNSAASTTTATLTATTTAVHTDSASNNATTAATTALTNGTLQATTLPQATTTASATAAASTTPQLTAQVGSDAWQQSLGQQIVMFNKDGQYSAKLRLHPEELGSLQISMTITDNQAQLHFVSAHSQVRAALESAMPYLRTSLAENGIDLGQASVGSESTQSGQQQSGDSQNASTRFDYLGNEIDGVGDSLSVPASLQRAAANVSGVDIFA